jgi:hypothetical protein
MSTSRALRVGAAIVAADALAFAAAVPADAAKRPKVTLTLPPQADQGAPIPYTFTASRVRRHDKLVVQRQTGTAKVYRTVAVLLHARSGSGTLPPLSLGDYRYRIAVLGRHRGHRRVLASRRTRVAVFGTVPLGRLINGDSGTYTTPTRTFPYVFRADANEVTGDTELTVSPHSNHCRSIHFDFVPESYYDSDDPVTITIVQQSLDPVSASARPDDFGALDAPLRPGESWSLQTSVFSDRDANEVDFNGWASCDRVGSLTS